MQCTRPSPLASVASKGKGGGQSYPHRFAKTGTYISIMELADDGGDFMMVVILKEVLVIAVGLPFPINAAIVLVITRRTGYRVGAN